DLAEDVDEAEIVEHACEPRALLGQESRVLLIAAPVAQVDGMMRDVPVAAQHDLAPAAHELRKMRQEGVEEAVFRRLPMLAARSRRQIQADHRQLVEISLQVAALGIELHVSEAGRGAMRQLGVQPDAAIALALRGMKS